MRDQERSDIERWLRQLSWALSAMPAQDRDDIVAESRSHLHEVIAAGQPPRQALAGFGDARDYAAQFVDEMEIAGALATRKFGPLFFAVGRRVHRSVLAAAALGVVLALLTVSLVAAAVLLYELKDPVHTGLWSGGGNYFIGIIDDPRVARDLLGMWIYPLGVAAIASSLLLGRLVLVRAVRRLA